MQRNQRSNCQHLLDPGKSKRVPEKHLLLLYWLCKSLWLCPQQTGKFFKRWGYETTWSASWEICMQVKKQQLELDMVQQTRSKVGKEYIKVVCCHPAYLTCMKSTSWEMLDWMKHKLESRFLGEISITSDTQMTPPLWQKLKNWRTSWWKWKRRVKRLAWGSTFRKLRSWHPVPSLHSKSMVKQWQTLFWGAAKSLKMVTAAMKLKDTCSLEEKLWSTQTAY